MGLTRRTQILLDDQRYRRLRSRAGAEGLSVGAFIRRAVDRALDEEPGDEQRRAAGAFLAATPLPVGEPDELARELEDATERDAP